MGARNIGATNVWRVLGRKFGLFTFARDLRKGWLAVIIGQWIAAHWAIHVALPHGHERVDYFDPGYAGITAAIGCILGHTFPVWLRFKGGKGRGDFARRDLRHDAARGAHRVRDLGRRFQGVALRFARVGRRGGGASGDRRWRCSSSAGSTAGRIFTSRSPPVASSSGGIGRIFGASSPEPRTASAHHRHPLRASHLRLRPRSIHDSLRPRWHV